MTRRDYKEGLSVWVFVVFFVILSLVVVGFLRLGGLAFLKPILGIETRIYQTSIQYVEAKQRLCLALVDDYEELTTKIAETDSQELTDAYRSQQLAILKRLRVESELLAPEQVPASVRTLLRRERE